MKDFKLKIKEFLFLNKSRIYLFVFLISFISLLFIFFSLINLSVIFNISEILIIDLTFRTAVILSTIYVILFLPTFPIFFIILKKMDFNNLEKLSLTILSNLSYYILIGYFGFLMGIPLTGAFYLIIILVPFFMIIFYIIIGNKKYGKFTFLNLNKSIEKSGESERFSLKNYLKENIPLNGFLLVIFILLLCIVIAIRFDPFGGTDPWIHITIIKMISNMKSLPIEEYYGLLGLHIFCNIIHLFSRVDFLLIPRFFPFYTFFLSTLIFYNILMRIFKNQNLAIFGVFLLEFSSLGFSNMMIQFWPSGLAIIQCLAIFFLLYVRFQNFIKLDRPTKKIITSNIIFYYGLITFFFISALLTHALTTIIFLISFIWVYLIYFIKDYRRGIDLIFLCSLTGIFLFLYNVGISTNQFWFIWLFDFPWYIIIIALVMVGVIGSLFIWRMQKSILFTKGRFKLTIMGKKSKFYKYIEENIIKPLIICVVIFLTIIFLIGNSFIFNLVFTSILIGIEIMIFAAFAIWGYILFQKKPKGKYLFIWADGFGFILLCALLLELFPTNNHFWVRIIYMIPPIIIIGFISYIYKLIKTDSIKTKGSKFFLIFIVVFSLFATFTHEIFSFEPFIVKKREINTFKWHTNYSTNKSVIITEFGIDNIFIYYKYPYNTENKDLKTDDIYEFISIRQNLFPPENHYDENGVNRLKEIKNSYGNDVYITIPDYYFINLDWQLFEEMSEEQIEKYYNLTYLNRICSSKNINGKDAPLYWVI